MKRRRFICGIILSNAAATVNGADVPTSAMTRRRGQQPTTTAGSIPFRRTGRFCPGDARHAHLATDSVDKYLMHCEQALTRHPDLPFDTSASNPGYINRIPAGCTPEWRAIHTCGNLGSHGIRSIGRQPAYAGTDDHDQRGEPRVNCAGNYDPQGRTVRRAARRSRRADPVHRFGRLEVSAGCGRFARECIASH